MKINSYGFTIDVDDVISQDLKCIAGIDADAELQEIANDSAVENTKKLLRENICVVYFTKANGERRELSCTLKPELIPESTQSAMFKEPEHGPKITVWDLEKEAWRAFRLDRVISIKWIENNQVMQMISDKFKIGDGNIINVGNSGFIW